MNDDELYEKLKHPAAFGAFVEGDLANYLVAATPGGIEAQEAAGQSLLVESQMLPKEGTITPRFYAREGEPTYQAKLEAWGFVFGKEVDDLFVECQLPPGWKKVAEQHALWSHLEDEKGRDRAGIFYKAAFYDRCAHFQPRQRFWFGTYYAASPDEPENIKDSTPDSQVCEAVRDNATGTILYHTAPYRSHDWEGRDACGKQCRLWIEQHYPHYQDPFAYWEDE